MLFSEHWTECCGIKKVHWKVKGWNKCFKSYPSNRKQCASINGCDSNIADIKLGVPQRSVLGPLLFLVYINNLSYALKFCSVHHFADDANLLWRTYFGKLINSLIYMLALI